MFTGPIISILLGLISIGSATIAKKYGLNKTFCDVFITISSLMIIINILLIFFIFFIINFAQG